MANNFDLSIRLKTAVEGLNEVAKLISEIEELGGATQESASRSKALSDELRELQQADKLVSDFRDLKLEVGSTSDALSEAQRDAQRLGRELAESSQPTRRLEKDFEKARKTVNRLKETQLEQVRALDRNRSALREAGIDSRNLAESQGRIRSAMAATSGEVEDLTRELREARDQSSKEFKDPTDRLERGAESSGRAMEGLGARIRRTASVAVGSVAAFFGIREAIQGIVGIVRVGGEFEILQKRLEALTGSAEAGEEAFEWIQDFTKNTPFQLEQVTDAFVRAKAFGLDPMDGTLQSIADQAAKTGGGMEALNGIVTALGQAYSKGKVQTEEMLQLIERGVPAWDLLAKATGRSKDELQAMTTAGKLGREEIRLLIQEIGNASEGAAADQMDTLRGLVSNLQDQFKQFLVLVNEQGALEYFKKQVSDIADAMKEMRASGELQEWAKRISNAITGLVETLKTIGTTLYEYRDAIVAVAKAWGIYKAAQLAAGLGSLANLLRRQAIPAMLSFGTATGTATGSLGKLRAGLRAIPGPAKIVAIAAALLGLDKVLIKAGKSLGEFLAKNSAAARSLEETEARIEAQARQRLASLDEELAKLEQYRDARRLTAQEAAKLSEEERAAAEEQLRGQEALLQTEYRRALQFEALGHDMTESMEAVGQALKDTQQALADLQAGSDAAARSMESGISAAALDLVDNFQAMTKAGESAADAAEALFEGFDPSNTTSVRQLVEAIGAITEESFEAGQAIDREIRQRLDNMTGQELRRFSITLRSAFDGGTEAMRRFGDLADEIADAALQNIGTSLQEIRTGISLMESEALDSFQAFTQAGTRSADEVKGAINALQDDISSPEAVDALRGLLDAWASESGVKIDEVNAAFDGLAENVQGTAQQIEQDLREAITAAGDEQALEQVKARIRELWDQGKIGADQYSQALAEARDRQRELADEAQAAGQRTADGLRQASQSAEEMAAASQRAKDQAFEAAQQATSVGAHLTAFFNNAAERVVGLGQKVHDQFLRLLDMEVPNRELDETRTRIQALTEEINAMERQIGGFSAISGWMTDVSVAAKQAERDFLQQRLAVQGLVEDFQNGDYSAQLMASSVDDLESRFDLLGDQDLAPLRQAISQARSEVDGLNDSLESTLSSLRQELAGLQGDTARVEEIRFQERLLELEQQLQQARAAGDQEAIRKAREAIDLLKQAHDIKLDNIREEAEAEAQAEQERRQREDQRRRQEIAQQEPEQPTERPEPARQTEPRGQRIELALPGGTANLTGSPEDVNRLLEFLNEAGLRAIE